MSQQNNYPTHDDIVALAQKFWEEEGQPEGKAEEHWQRAEEQLRQSHKSDAQAQSQGA
jgi:F0F1-type ATP synthase epsilon subunit